MEFRITWTLFGAMLFASFIILIQRIIDCIEAYGETDLSKINCFSQWFLFVYYLQYSINFVIYTVSTPYRKLYGRTMKKMRNLCGTKKSSGKIDTLSNDNLNTEKNDVTFKSIERMQSFFD